MSTRRKAILDAHQLKQNEIDADAAKALRDIQYVERKKNVDNLKKELFNL
jgi:ribosomal protein L29